MKNLYQIQEICRLYHIGADSLRYYEKIGLIQPQRSAGNYRLYSLSDIWRLNVIRDLLKLGFSTGQIKTYLDARSVATTRSLLAKNKPFCGRESCIWIKTSRMYKSAARASRWRSASR